MQAIDDFLSYLQADRGYSDKTVICYREALTSFRSFYKSLDENLDWQTLDADVVRQWMMADMKRGLKARTVAKNLSALRTFYKYMLRTERVARDPVRLVKSPKVKMPLPTFLRRAEVDRLFDEVTFPDTFEGLRDRTVLLTFYHTGIRLAELVGLDVQHIDLAQGELKVTGKRNKQRIVPFGKELRDALSDYIAVRAAQAGAAGGPLFLGNSMQRISPSKAQSIVRNYLSLVTTQKKKSPHVLRHTYATEMLNNGADLEAIKELLGHESIATTEVYTHTTFADLKKEYEHAHPRA